MIIPGVHGDAALQKPSPSLRDQGLGPPEIVVLGDGPGARNRHEVVIFLKVLGLQLHRSVRKTELGVGAPARSLVVVPVVLVEDEGGEGGFQVVDAPIFDGFHCGKQGAADGDVVSTAQSLFSPKSVSEIVLVQIESHFGPPDPEDIQLKGIGPGGPEGRPEHDGQPLGPIIVLACLDGEACISPGKVGAKPFPLLWSACRFYSISPLDIPEGFVEHPEVPADLRDVLAEDPAANHQYVSGDDPSRLEYQVSVHHDQVPVHLAGYGEGPAKGGHVSQYDPGRGNAGPGGEVDGRRVIEEVDDVLLDPPGEVGLFDPRLLPQKWGSGNPEDSCHDYQTLLHRSLPCGGTAPCRSLLWQGPYQEPGYW